MIRRKTVKQLFILGILGLSAVCFVFIWWVYSIFSFPLENVTSNSDYDSYLASKVPVALTESSGTILDNKFYLVGGLGAFAQSLQTFLRYNNTTGKWERLIDIPFRVNHAGLVSGDHKIYVLGGFKPLGIRVHGSMLANWKPRSTFLIFDPEKNQWESGPDMPYARGAGGVCYWDSTIYYVGGINEEKEISNSFFKFDLRTQKWDILPSMPTARDHLRMEAVDGVLFAISGRKDDMLLNLPDVEAFDTRNLTWSKMADIPNPRGGFGSTVYQGKIYTFGGEEVWSCQSNVEEFNPKTNQWRKLHDLPEARHGICAGVIDNEIHLISGGLKPRISISKIHRVIRIK